MIRFPAQPASVSEPPEVRVSTVRNGGDGGPASETRPLSTSWAKDELLARTRRGWLEVYRRPIGDREALEILMNVKRFAEVLVKAEEGATEP